MGQCSIYASGIYSQKTWKLVQYSGVVDQGKPTIYARAKDRVSYGGIEHSIVFHSSVATDLSLLLTEVLNQLPDKLRNAAKIIIRKTKNGKYKAKLHWPEESAERIQCLAKQVIPWQSINEAAFNDSRAGQKGYQSYTYNAMARAVLIAGLDMQLALNPDRAEYILKTTQGIPSVKRISAAAKARQRLQPVRSIPPAYPPRWQHDIPPAYAADGCPFCVHYERAADQADKINKVPIEIENIQFNLFQSDQPWGHKQLVFATVVPLPQAMTIFGQHPLSPEANKPVKIKTKSLIIATLTMLDRLGRDVYEATFISRGAAASVWHWHVNYRQGFSPIWKSLDNGKIKLKVIDHHGDASLFRERGWPAEAFLIRSSNKVSVAQVLNDLLHQLDRYALIPESGDPVLGLPYSIIIRFKKDNYEILVFPRDPYTSDLQASGLNVRFGAAEMGGLFFAYSASQFKEWVECLSRTGQWIVQGLKVMSVSSDIIDQIEEKIKLRRKFLNNELQKTA